MKNKAKGLEYLSRARDIYVKTVGEKVCHCPSILVLNGFGAIKCCQFRSPRMSTSVYYFELFGAIIA
jgi:hypothetical protein